MRQHEWFQSLVTAARKCSGKTITPLFDCLISMKRDVCCRQQWKIDVHFSELIVDKTFSVNCKNLPEIMPVNMTKDDLLLLIIMLPGTKENHSCCQAVSWPGILTRKKIERRKINEKYKRVQTILTKFSKDFLQVRGSFEKS